MALLQTITTVQTIIAAWTGTVWSRTPSQRVARRTAKTWRIDEANQNNRRVKQPTCENGYSQTIIAKVKLIWDWQEETQEKLNLTYFS